MSPAPYSVSAGEHRSASVTPHSLALEQEIGQGKPSEAAVGAVSWIVDCLVVGVGAPADGHRHAELVRCAGRVAVAGGPALVTLNPATTAA